MDKRWWAVTKNRLGLPDIIFKRKIKGRNRYRKFVPHWYHLVSAVFFLGLTTLGALCVAMFFATSWGLTRTRGIVDDHSSAYQALATTLDINAQVLGSATTSASASTSSTISLPRQQLETLEQNIIQAQQNLQLQQQALCQLSALAKAGAPYEAHKIASVWNRYSTAIITRMIFVAAAAGEFDLSVPTQTCITSLTNNPAFADGIWSDVLVNSSLEESATVYDWLDPQYWTIAKGALEKDKGAIYQAAKQVDLNPRLIVSSLLVEQLRLFFSQRELFKSFFQPLKQFANSTQISLGVMAIKPETAQKIEQNLTDPNSPYYLGDQYSQLLAYASNENPSSKRIERLSSEENNHYWSYLYGAIYIKQIMTQWEKAGFSINERPEIISTLYNVGFSQSQPKADPKVGGSSVVVNGRTYSFGHLASEFYFSGELLGEYPQL